jgi:hypothetical protein
MLDYTIVDVPGEINTTGIVQNTTKTLSSGRVL